MFGWVGKLVDRIAEGVVRRGQAIVGSEDRALDERRTAVRAVREAITEAMTRAEEDRDNGRGSSRTAAVAAANRAGAIVHEVADEDARRLVIEWKARFDGIEKGWKEGGTDASETRYYPPGYPEPSWSVVRQSADAAFDRLGVVLRDLLERRK